MRFKAQTIGLLYRHILKPIFFLFDPEKIHDLMLKFGKLLGKNSFAGKLTSWAFEFQDPILSQQIAGINFKNPIGLAAGFDKNAHLTEILPSVGFGFEEVGSITALPCEGNEKPRLWRLKKSRGLVVNYGLTNDGAEKISERLRAKKLNFPLGISIAKTNCRETADTDKGIEDYVKAFRLLKNLGDYTTINISCPNAFGGQPFNDAPRFEKLMEAIYSEEINKPLFVKLSADLTDSQLQELFSIAKKYPITGFVCTNLTKDRTLLKSKILDPNCPETGGISGKPVQDLSDQMIKRLYRLSRGKYIIIGCGGVFSAADAYRKIRLGASLIQLITGMIFEGPQLIGQINSGLVEMLQRDGFKNISEAVGADNPI